MKAASLTDIGRVRTSNQDTVFLSLDPVGVLPNLFLAADGMGGHRGGDYCSRELVRRLVETLGNMAGEPVLAMRSAIEEVNAGLYRESVENPELSGMGSTLVACFVDGDTAYAFNAGDSRLYLLNPGSGMRQITRDHSYVEEMVSAGRMKRGSEIYNRNKNIITRAVGIDSRVEVDVFEFPFPAGAGILLCTDGLTNMLDDLQIEEIIRGEEDPERAVQKLTAAANEQGGRDNISAVLALSSEKEAAE